jgi:2-methylfumaryl-CoA isomerase
MLEHQSSIGASPGLLSGIRIVEGSAFVAAPSCGMTLAQLGADVIRFDPIGGGIDAARWPCMPDGTSLYWAGLNKGKRSVMVDIRNPEGQALLTAIIAAPGPDAGVFVTNFPATRGWMSYGRLRQTRDDLVMCAVVGNPDGSTAVDYTVNCAVGYPNVTGPVGSDAPVNHVLPAWDFLCGQTAALGIVSALRHRDRTGDGQLLTLALSDVAMAAVSAMGHISEAQVLHTERPRVGNDLYGAFGRDFPTSDARRVMVVAISDKQWSGLCEATGTTEVLVELARQRGVDFGDEGQRFLARDAISAHLAPWFAVRWPRSRRCSMSTACAGARTRALVRWWRTTLVARPPTRCSPRSTSPVSDASSAPARRWRPAKSAVPRCARRHRWASTPTRCSPNFWG